MSYTINLTNGNVFAVIPDGTINNSSTMTLVGKNYAGYGQFLDDNFIHLLESGANSSAPSSPLVGQLWFNTTTGSLNVYKGSSTWKSIAATTAASVAPSNNTAGDLWYDSGNVQLNVYSGTSWVLVGPTYTGNAGLTGAIPATITDSTSVPHVVTELYVANTIVGIVSKDATFTPGGTPIPGFATVSPGIQISSNISGAVFTGSATNALTVNGVAANNIPTLSANTNTFSGNITISSPSTLNVNGIRNSGTSATGTIGSPSAPFATVYAQATTALYADLAERFAADEIYEAGTVVELGGSAEVTRVTAELSDSVFGVISTRAAYLMNGGAGSDETHPPIAMTGRVPVKVTGTVLKGDRLVSAGNGIARAAQPGEATAFNVIGRALVSKLDTGLGTVEAIVTIK